MTLPSEPLKVILEVANFKEEGLVTPEEKNRFWKFDGSYNAGN